MDWGIWGDADGLSIGFCHEHALILYVYLSNEDTESVLTVCLSNPLCSSSIPSDLSVVLHRVLQRLIALSHIRGFCLL